VITINSITIPAISFQNYSFIYGNDKTKDPALSNITFDLFEGETLILAGPSGSGKSTISYAINGIIPWRTRGLYKGDIKILGKSTIDYQFIDLCKVISLIKQNPLEQLVTFTVRDEIAFGLENLRLPKEEIEARVKHVADLMGITQLLDREIDQLSGGQKQLTILSSFLVMSPKILILDEPIAFLDQKSESLLLNCLRGLISNKELNLTTIIIEHRLSRVSNLADKIIVLNENGQIAIMGKISEIYKGKFYELKACNVRVPWLLDLFFEFSNTSQKRPKYEIPVNFKEAFEFIPSLNNEDLKLLFEMLIKKEIEPQDLKDFEDFKNYIDFDDLYITSLKEALGHQTKTSLVNNVEEIEGSNVILETRHLTFEYPNSNITAINDLNIKIERGDFIGLVGPNGAGKTTLLYLLANLYPPTKGQILYEGKNIQEVNTYDYAKEIGFIFQNPENMIFKSTIQDEILYGPTNFGISNNINSSYLSKLINLIGNIEPSKNPYHLSWGQKRRLNLSSVFVYSPNIILLDEPFIGQDQRTIDSLIKTLYIENKRGKTIIISSHDYHLLLKYTKKIMELGKDGRLRDYDSKNNFFKKRHTLGPVILLEELRKEMLRRNV
jgi:energy-coupling factor transporter ATP-binding protein EcfA2